MSKQEFKISGKEIKEKVMELIKQGNLRRLVFKNKDNKEVFAINLTWAVILALILPFFALLVFILAIVLENEISLEKDEK